ncbi:hypothetical protein [Luteibacter sp. ME-Dv--P-043b]|uniref:hypothetical protein n=1 Tax=Luteibacter sp. ME-Dv--P-043b TaxID=3040291 RepID=UPI0025550177|nr:hypothetical protein [Luteibacter sp. ME-Dv--P-043b]
MDYAELTWWPALGVVLATEGKNRVELLRRTRADTIPGEVAIAPYPTAESIRLYRVGESETSEVWAILGDRLVQALPGYRLSAGLLRAYGVADPTPWPRRLPSPVLVRGLLLLHEGVIDLDALAEPEPTTERIPLALAALPGVRWRTGRILLTAITLTIASLVSFALHWWQVGIGLFALLNGGFGAALIPWFTVSKTEFKHV